MRLRHTLLAFLCTLHPLVLSAGFLVPFGYVSLVVFSYGGEWTSEPEGIIVRPAQEVLEERLSPANRERWEQVTGSMRNLNLPEGASLGEQLGMIARWSGRQWLFALAVLGGTLAYFLGGIVLFGILIPFLLVGWMARPVRKEFERLYRDLRQELVSQTAGDSKG